MRSPIKSFSMKVSARNDFIPCSSLTRSLRTLQANSAASLFSAYFVRRHFTMDTVETKRSFRRGDGDCTFTLPLSVHWVRRQSTCLTTRRRTINRKIIIIDITLYLSGGQLHVQFTCKRFRAFEDDVNDSG